MTFPRIHFGVYLVPPENTALAVEQALEIGYRGVDSARYYENEAESAQGIQNFLKKHPEVKRSDIFYTSKVYLQDFGYEKTRAAIQESLEKVKNLKYIDLYLIHSSHGGPQVRAETWRALEEAKKKGDLKNIGVSNWGVKHLKQLGETQNEAPFTNQIELNPWLQHRDIVDYCKEHNIVVEAWSPLTRGFRLNDPELQLLSEKYGCSPAAVLIQWALQYGTVPIVKSVNPKRMRENLEASKHELSKEDFNSLGSPDEYFVTAKEWDPTRLD